MTDGRKAAERREPDDGARITVALIPKAAGDLQQLQDRTSLSKTDLVNRAISAYEFFEAEIRSGSRILVRRDDGETLLAAFL